MRFTYIVQLILVVNVTVSAMNVLPAEGLLFFLILSMVMSAWQLLIGMWIVCAAVLLMVQ